MEGEGMKEEWRRRKWGVIYVKRWKDKIEMQEV